jgi:hypothetical protein
MTRRILIGAAALVATAVPASASAGGNIANGSVGTTQVGSTASAPQASVNGTTITVPISIVGTGGNTSNHSIGTAQIGDGNTASGSLGTVQVSAVHGSPTAHADARVARADASAPFAIPGSGPNSAKRSIVTIQLGGGHSTQDSLVRAQATDLSVQPSGGVTKGSGTLVQVGAPGQKSVVLLLGPPKPREHVAVQLTRDFSFDPANLLFQATAVGVRPDVLAAVDPIAALTFGGTIGTGPNGGNTAKKSLGTAQVGSVTIAPVVGVDSSAFGSGATVGGSNTVDGAGTNLADTSLGTAQAGGGNTASDSAGTAQIGGLRLAPAAGLTTPYGVGALGGSSGIAGGSNSAAGSLGTVQIGGGNTSNGSAGTAQLGSISVGPTVQSTGTPAGPASVGGTSGIAGSGNDANGSVGTGQVGGGNGSSGSGGTLQSSGVTIGQTANVGDVSTGEPTMVGSGSGNSATGSLGTAQIGGGNSATNSIGTTQVGSPQQSGNPSGPPAQVLTATASPRQIALPSAARPTASSPSAAKRSSARSTPPTLGAHRTTRTGTLPFTGIDLLYAAIAGIVLMGAGVRLRRRAIA